METGVLYMDFTGTVSRDRDPRAVHMDFRGLSGTDGYCSGEAAAVLREKIREFGSGGIHFLDSGNYHYLTLFFLEQIREPFRLAVFDHHTDMQPPALLPLLSCGGWLRNALEENRYLRKVYLIGPPEKSLEETAGRENGRLECVSAEQLSAQGEGSLFRVEDGGFPVYFSVDKDVLRAEDARTNWDQGEMTLEALCRMLRAIGGRSRVLGADICGGVSPDTPFRQRAEAEEINSRTDRRLIKCIKEILTEEEKKNDI